MKLVIISGRSGSGKSTALNVLEDSNFYCIDNLPADLLPALIKKTKLAPNANQQLAVCIDARNHIQDIANLTNVIKELPDDVDSQVVYLDASSPILIKRFSETRRKHPLSNETTTLEEAIKKEKHILEPIAAIADIHINTNTMNIHELKDMVKKSVLAHADTTQMSVLFKSFGFKNGIPIDADIIYDVRILPNPYWIPELRALTGQSDEIKSFLSEQEDVQLMLNDITTYLEHWLPKFEAKNRSYVTIAIGCTGGKHRSVFLTERLKAHFDEQFPVTQLIHRDLPE